MDLEPGLTHYRALLAGLAFLAGCHAHLKVSPFFAATWFGSTLVFGWCWAGQRGDPELVLLPGLVVYTAAAVTKGLVESRPSLAGAHSLHVLLTGLLAGLLALPFEALARPMGWPVPRPAGRLLLGLDPDWLGGVTLDPVAQWTAVGLVLYGGYKILDHVGLPRWLQVPALFGVMPFLARAAAWLHGQV